MWPDGTAYGDSRRDQLVCEVCKSNERIMFVGQVYAPVNDLDRSLYIFVCNKRACSLSSKGWRILRNQNKRTVAATPAKSKQSAIGTENSKKSSLTSSWDFLSSISTTSPASDIDNSSELDKLEILLRARDHPTESSPPPPSISSCPPISSSSSSSSTTSNNPPSSTHCETVEAGNEVAARRTCWPCWILEDVPDPFISIERSEDDDDDSSPQDNLGGDDEKISKMLEDYLSFEEDTEIVSVLRQHVSMNGIGIGAGGGSKKQDLQNLKKASGKLRSGGKDEGTRSNKLLEEENENFQQQRLSRMDARSRFEWDFQRRVALEPRQVLRYDYGAQPLWCTYPFPDCSLVPACDCCGKPRAFEMQLMPALLSLLPSSSSSSSTSTEPAQSVGQVEFEHASIIEPSIDAFHADTDIDTGADTDTEDIKPTSPTFNELQLNSFLQKLGDGIDFGVVAIYSCPDSCQSSSLATEFALVQPPSDIGL